MLEFKKCENGFIILSEGNEVGILCKDESKNYQFNHVATFNFKIQGYNHTAADRNWKQAKIKAQKLYDSLMDINRKYGYAIISA